VARLTSDFLAVCGHKLVVALEFNFLAMMPEESNVNLVSLLSSVDAFKNNSNYPELVSLIPHEVLPAFQSFAEAVCEVEGRYENLSKKIADYLWKQQENLDDFERRVAPFGDLYVMIISFNCTEPELVYSDEGETTAISGDNLLTHYKIYEKYKSSGLDRIRDRKSGT